MRFISYAPTLCTILEDKTLPAARKTASGKMKNRNSTSCIPIDKSLRMEGNENRPSSGSRRKSDSSLLTKTHLIDEMGRSILHDAVRQGDIDRVQCIVESTPNLINQGDIHGNTPLHYAAHASTKFGVQIAYILLKSGANANALNYKKQSALFINVISIKEDYDCFVRLMIQFHESASSKVTGNAALAKYARAKGLHRLAHTLSTNQI
jgi:ankyrin repeat protein